MILIPVIGSRLDRTVCSERHAPAIARSLSITSMRHKTVTVFPSGEVRGNRAGWKEATPMPAKYKGPYFFTEEQVQKYNRTLGRLRNLVRDAFLELRKIGRSNLTNKRYRDAGVFFATVAAQMTPALQFLVQIQNSAQRPSRTLVEFVY